MYLRFRNHVDIREYVQTVVHKRVRRMYVLDCFIIDLMLVFFIWSMTMLVTHWYQQRTFFSWYIVVVVVSISVGVCASCQACNESEILHVIKEQKLVKRGYLINCLDNVIELWYVNRKLCKMFMASVIANGDEYECFVTLANKAGRYNIEVNFPGSWHEPVRIKNVVGAAFTSECCIVAMDNDLFICENNV